MGAALAKGVTYNADSSVKSCLFCDICADKPGMRQTEVAYEDEKVVVFSPLERCAAQHWLVVPRAHIHNAVALTKVDVPLLGHMRSVGEKVLKERAGPEAAGTLETQFVFHVAPFNSIDHLHLHCQAMPFTSWWSSAKYRAGTRWCWTFDQVRHHIDEEKPIP